jgi:hypothetical protein
LGRDKSYFVKKKATDSAKKFSETDNNYNNKTSKC